MRSAMKNIKRYIAAPYTAKFRTFIFVDSSTIPDAMAYAISSDSAFVLGVLSSKVHVLWSLSSGGRLGVGNDPGYNGTASFGGSVPTSRTPADSARRGRQPLLKRRMQRERQPRSPEHLGPGSYRSRSPPFASSCLVAW